MQHGHPSFKGWQESARLAGYDEHRLARHLGVTQRTLQRWWLATEIGPLETWLRDQRLPGTVRLLELFGSVKEVAYLSGYSSPTVFGRHFMRVHGMTPGGYIARFKAASPWWSDPEMHKALQTMQEECREMLWKGLNQNRGGNGCLAAWLN